MVCGRSAKKTTRISRQLMLAVAFDGGISEMWGSCQQLVPRFRFIDRNEYKFSHSLPASMSHANKESYSFKFIDLSDEMDDSCCRVPDVKQERVICSEGDCISRFGSASIIVNILRSCVLDRRSILIQIYN